MDEAWADLGKRMVQAARLAVAVHLYESHLSSRTYRQRVTIGGAGPTLLKDEALPSGGARPRVTLHAEGDRA